MTADRAAAARRAQHRAAEGVGELAAAVVRETLGAGGRACRPLIARDGLGPTLIEPGARLRWRSAAADCAWSISCAPCTSPMTAIAALEFGDETVALAPDDAVILAVPPDAAAALVPGLDAPNEFRAIVNAHFRIEPPAGAPPMIGVINGTAEWLFAFPGPPLGHDQRRRPAARHAARGTGEADLGRRRERHGPAGGAAALADRARAARDLRRHAGAGRQAPGRRRPAGAISCSPATGPIPACRPPSKARSAPATAADCRADRRRCNDRRSDNSTTTHQRSIARSRAPRRCSRRQRPDGHWVFELEADATIPAEYVLLRHYLGEPVDAALEAKIARLSAPHPGRARRLAAVPRRRLSTSARP